MNQLDIPDLCARLDRLKALCDRLEQAQGDRRRYHELIDLISAEADAFRRVVEADRPGSRRADVA
jgi:hypothetical protein